MWISYRCSSQYRNLHSQNFGMFFKVQASLLKVPKPTGSSFATVQLRNTSSVREVGLCALASMKQSMKAMCSTVVVTTISSMKVFYLGMKNNLIKLSLQTKKACISQQWPFHKVHRASSDACNCKDKSFLILNS